MIEYSEKELQLIDYFGYSEYINQVEPVVLYDMMKDKAFLHNITGSVTDSVRRCIIALQENKVCRLTEEWDNLINIGYNE